MSLTKGYVPRPQKYEISFMQMSFITFVSTQNEQYPKLQVSAPMKLLLHPNKVQI